MDVMPDLDLARQREAARAAMAAAEREMAEHAHDLAKFEVACQKLVRAEAEVKRLDFIERHSAQVAEADAARAKRKDLEEAQQRARVAHERARVLVTRVGPAVADLEKLLADLKDAQVAVDRGVHFENYAVRDRLIPRPTITPKLPVDADLAVRLLRAARDLVRLSPLSMPLAEMRASQRSIAR